MALVDQTIIKREIPHEPGEWFEFRKLSWVDIQAAEDAVFNSAMTKMHQMPAVMLQESIRQREDRRASGSEGSPNGMATQEGPGSAGTVPESRVLTSVQDIMQKYDLGTLLRHGIHRWSYQVPVSVENVRKLDAETAYWAAQEIVWMFAPEDPEAELGKEYVDTSFTSVSVATSTPSPGNPSSMTSAANSQDDSPQRSSEN